MSKATYPRYRFNGPARGSLSRARDGAAIVYDVVEEHGRDLVVIGRSGELEARVAVASTEAGFARLVLGPVSPRAIENKVAHLTMLHASGLAMLWDWPKGIDADVPVAMGRMLANALNSRSKLQRLMREKTGDRERIVFAITS